MAAYQCIRHANADAFLERATPWLTQAEAEYNLFLSIVAQLRKTPIPNSYLSTIEHDGEIVGCAFRTPPYKLSVTRMPVGATEALCADLLTVYSDVPAVLGNETTAAAVAGKLAQAYGKRAQIGMRQRIYALDKVIPPANPPAGRLRLAQPSDNAVLADWFSEFARETDHGPADVRSFTASNIANKTVFFWDDDGPRAIAMWSGLTPNGVRVGFVYTPPELRGKGYASACVAGVSQRALDSGYKFCCLYTNLSNATSNKIYQDIGYEPVCDVVDYDIV